MEDVGIFYGYLVYVTSIWYFRWTFGIFHVNLVSFPSFWNVVLRKSGSPAPDRQAGINEFFLQLLEIKKIILFSA
jgi:hypothetical protein